jgi:voltage-gated potassium channel
MTAGRPSVLEEFGGLLPIALGVYALKDSSDDFATMKAELRTWARKDPIDALIATVFGGGLAFYVAERNTNANCVTPWDGILYMSTALSVGYDNLFPTTPIGHALATFAQTFGPSLANAALEPPAAELAAAAAEAAARATDDAEVNRAILARLEDIVKLLNHQR